MINEQIIETLAAKIIKQIEFYTGEMGLTMDAAKARIKCESVAGPAVWALVDQRIG